jgi:DNA-directed RNA polymerase subunit RPC12/RpoP
LPETLAQTPRRWLVTALLLCFWSLFLVAGTRAQGPGRPGFPPRPGPTAPPLQRPPAFNNPAPNNPPTPKPPAFNNPGIPQVPGANGFGNHSMMGNPDPFGRMVWKCSKCGRMLGLVSDPNSPPEYTHCPACGARFANGPGSFAHWGSSFLLIVVYVLVLGTVATGVSLAVIFATKKKRHKKRRLADRYDPQFESA